MARQIQHIGTMVENLLGAIAMVNIEIDDRDAPDTGIVSECIFGA